MLQVRYWAWDCSLYTLKMIIVSTCPASKPILTSLDCCYCY